MHYISDRHRSRPLSRAALLLGTTALTLGAGCNIGWTDQIATGDVLLGSNYGVGNFSDGTLIINNGTDVTVPYFVAGAVPGVTGTVTVTGAGTTVTTDDLYIGDAGNGILTISDGASFVTQRARWAVDYAATSSVTVTGAGSSLEIAASANIGDLGNASLTIADGAHVIFSNTDSDRRFVLGVDYYSSGTLNIGAAAGEIAVAAGTLDADTVEFGYGTGTIVFNHTNTDYEFDAAMTGTGSVLFYSGDTILTGTSSISGTTSVRGGTATVAGSTASYATDGLIIDGTPGTAMTIENGADVSAGTVSLATSATTTGRLSVTGVGSSLTSTNLQVGNSGTGTLTVEDGADVTSQYAWIGLSGSGESTVSGEGSSLTASNVFLVGFQGSGVLTVEDGADVNGGDTYFGYDLLTSGTVTMTGAGSNLTASDLAVGYYGAGVLTVADDATVTVGSGGGTMHIASELSSVSAVNIGAAAGETAVAAGTINAGVVAFGSGTGTLVFNHTDTDYEFDTGISGYGKIDVYSGTTTLTGNLSGYTGIVEIYGGKLSVNSTMSSTDEISVYDGGIMGGSGTLGEVTLASGATIAPGNSIGTLTIDDDLTFGTGSIYAVEVNDQGNSDFIDVEYEVTIDAGATVSVTPENGTDTGSTYTPGITYTILSAGHGITGSFSSVTENFAYLSAALSYDYGNVYLTLNQQTSDFSSAVTAPNQVAAANAIESLASSNELYDAVLSLTTEEVEGAYAALSGESLANADQLLQSRSVFSRNTLTNRIRTAGSNDTTAMSGLAAYGEDGIRAITAAPEKSEAWISGFGNWTRNDGTADVAGASANGGGLLFGLDRAFGDGWRFGAMGGYGQDSISSTDTEASATVDSYYLGLYGSRDLGPLSMRFGAIHAFQQTDSKRDVSFNGFDEHLSADYDGSTSQAFVEGAWHINRDLLHVEPFAGFAYTQVRTDAFTETGGAAALSREAVSDGQLVSSLGLRADRDIAWEGMLGKVSAGLAWQHSFGDLTTESTYAFSGSSSFSVTSAPSDRDTAIVNLGLSLDVTKATTLSLDYIGRFGRDTIDNTATGKLNIKF